MFAFYVAVYSNILATFNIPYYVLLIEWICKTRGALYSYIGTDGGIL